MTKKNPRKPGPGRPRSAARSALVAAQICRQDALARRTARQVHELLAAHMTPETVAEQWGIVRAHVEKRCRRIPADVAPAIVEAAAHCPGRVHRACLDGIDAALRSLAGSALAPGRATPARRAPRLPASTSLASARARQAELHARLIDGRERIVAGALVPVDRVRLHFADRAVSLKSRLRALPAAHTPMIAAVGQAQGAAAVEALLADRIGAVLTELDRGGAIGGRPA
jgi:hypothetical protein